MPNNQNQHASVLLEMKMEPINPDFCLGCTPNIEQARKAQKEGYPSDIELRDALHGIPCPWSATKQPIVTTWDEVREQVERDAEICDKLRAAGQLPPWWERMEKLGLKYDDLFHPTQFYTDCAGISFYERCYLIQLLKQISRGSEQKIEKVNPFVTWAQSKGGSRWGGQTIAAGQVYGARVGVYPASVVGDYTADLRYKTKWESGEFIAAANQRQVQTCTVDLDGDELIDAIDLLLRSDRVVQIGNGIAVRGETTDSNGVNVAEIGGYWSHATCLTEILVILGTVYYRWDNTHGNRYSGQHGPKTGTLMRRSELRSFVGSNFHDTAGFMWVESPHGTTNLNLNSPEA